MVAKIKNNKKLLYASIGIFILGLSVLIPLGFAAYDSADVYFDNDNIKLGSGTLKETIDKMNHFAEVNCPSGMTCKSNTPKCKRATTLHTETCSQTSNNCAGAGYSSGATITYGNTSTTSGVLTTGDAFDCDVNGDGTFNATNERFYYVSDYYDTSTKNFNDKVAVLIYYSNVRGGVANPAATAYDCTNENWHGPVTAREQLPTTTQWSNISLYKTSRQILAKNNATATTGGTLPTSFSYAGYAARLLTYQEAYHGCNSYDKLPGTPGGLDTKCQFLMEGAKFSNSSLATNGPWLESPGDSSTVNVFGVYSSTRYLLGSAYAYYTTHGARPTIEVLKSEISY